MTISLRARTLRSGVNCTAAPTLRSQLNRLLGQHHRLLPLSLPLPFPGTATGHNCNGTAAAAAATAPSTTSRWCVGRGGKGGGGRGGKGWHCDFSGQQLSVPLQAPEKGGRVTLALLVGEPATRLRKSREIISG